MTKVCVESWEGFTLYLCTFITTPPTLDLRVTHSRRPKKYHVGPFSVALRRASATSAKLKYTVLSPEQGGEGGGSIKGKFFSLHFWMNWSIWSTFSIFSKFLSKTCRTAETPPPPYVEFSTKSTHLIFETFPKEVCYSELF